MSVESSSAPVALVTGGGSGIGRETALQFAKAGCKTVVADINKDAADQTCKLIKDTVPGAECLSVHCDITKPEHCKQMIQQVKDAFGRLDYAFNNAGVSGNPAPIHEMPLEEWDRVMSINLRGHFIAMQHELPLMLSTSTRPAIVLTSSVCGHMAHPGMSAYTASKFAIRGLAQAAATEYGPRGLRVNTVSPAEIDTPLLTNFAASGAVSKVVQLITEGAKLSLNDTSTTSSRAAAEAPASAPSDADNAQTTSAKAAPEVDVFATRPLRRMGKPAEVADAVVWLCMHADYITGTDLLVDGGSLCRLAG